jgi:photoactive yellow protein
MRLKCGAHRPKSRQYRGHVRGFLPEQMTPMNDVLILPAFDAPGLGPQIGKLDAEALDRLDFGVIGFSADGVVCTYNAFESKCAGLAPQRVLGQALFTVVAPCMNNYLVAQRFEDAAAGNGELDDTIDYVLTLRMRPVKVKLRLLATRGSAVRHVLVHRPS